MLYIKLILGCIIISVGGLVVLETLHMFIMWEGYRSISELNVVQRFAAVLLAIGFSTMYVVNTLIKHRENKT